MALGDFSAADKCTFILTRLREMFSQRVVEDDTLAPLVTAKSVLENQGMNALFGPGEVAGCIPKKVYWNADCDFEPDYNDVTAEALGCEVPSGAEDEGFSKEYNTNMFVSKTTRFAEQECNNDLFFVDRSAERIFAAIRAVRKGLADNIAAFLVANAQVNTWATGPGTIVGTTTEFGATDFSSLDLVFTLEQIAQQNQVMNLKMVNGKNFQVLARTAEFGACCEDQGSRNKSGLFNMQFDPWLDAAVGSDTTFLFDPTRIGFFSHADYLNNAPQRIGGYVTEADALGKVVVEETSVFGVNDPELSFLLNGTLVPLRYDVEVVKKCVGRQLTGIARKYIFDYYVSLRAMLDTAPTPCHAGTGILHFVNTGV